jgi:hypothetical protein
MEHRCGSRQSIPAVTTLYPRLSSPVGGAVRDVSISGMFVEATPDPFPLRSLVEIEFTVPAGAASRTCRCLGMVVRTTAEGVGLMFDRVNPAAVQRLMAAAGSPPAGQLTAPWPAAPDQSSRAPAGR